MEAFARTAVGMELPAFLERYGDARATRSSPTLPALTPGAAPTVNSWGQQEIAATWDSHVQWAANACGACRDCACAVFEESRVEGGASPARGVAVAARLLLAA